MCFDSGMRTTVRLAVIALLFPAAAWAQEKDRQPLQDLFFTQTVYPQERGETQLTLGALVDRTSVDNAALVPFSIEYGITNRWQIEAGWDGYTQFRSSVFQQLRTARLSVGTKYSLMNVGGSHVHVALGIDAEFPRPGALAEGEGEKDLEFEPYVAAAADLGSRLTLFGSYGLSVETGKQAGPPLELADDRGLVSGGFLIPLGHVTLAAEYTTRSDQLPWRLDGSALVTPSFVVHDGHWEAAVGVPIGTDEAAHRPGLAFHFIREF
jgi:hypothetical protein